MSFVNAHVFTHPTKKTTNYYWVRLLDDKTYGTNGFLYLATATDAYEVLPEDINFTSKTSVEIRSTIIFQGKPASSLLVSLSNTGGKLLAGYSIYSIAGTPKILDGTNMLPCDAGGYIKLDSKA